MRRKLTALAASSALLLGAGLTLAPSAHSAASVTDVALGCTGTAISYNTTPMVMVNYITANAGDSFTISNSNASGLGIAPLTLPSGYTSTSPSIASGGSVTITVGSADGTISIAAAATGEACSGKPNLSLDVRVSSGGSSSSSSSTPAVETLSLSVAASGATCTGGNPTGYAGSWLTLPSADQCTQSGPTAKPGAKLLGWATSSSFPIARAQAQIDKKWGVIDESINGVRMIFIPAGMATFVSGSNNLFPIWSA